MLIKYKLDKNDLVRWLMPLLVLFFISLIGVHILSRTQASSTVYNPATGNPSWVVTPNPDYWDACLNLNYSKQQCFNTEISAIDNSSDQADTSGNNPEDAALNLTPMTNINWYAYSKLSFVQQIFALVNDERIRRGLDPVWGTTTQLNNEVQAIVNTAPKNSCIDPAITDPNTNTSILTGNITDYGVGSNCAFGDLDAIDEVYGHMYLDGQPNPSQVYSEPYVNCPANPANGKCQASNPSNPAVSDNVDCTPAIAPTAQPCWGHRDNILNNQYSGYECNVPIRATEFMGIGVETRSSGALTTGEAYVLTCDQVPSDAFTFAQLCATGVYNPEPSQCSQTIPGTGGGGGSGPNLGTKLSQGAKMAEGNYITSPNGSYALELEKGGFLQLVQLPSSASSKTIQLWTPNTEETGFGNSLNVGSSGDLQLTNGSGKLIWDTATNASNSNASTNEYLTISNSGVLELFNSHNYLVWTSKQGRIKKGAFISSNGNTIYCNLPPTLTAGQSLYPGQCMTSPQGQYYLVFTTDGYIQLLTSGFAVVYSIPVNVSNPGRLYMQPDGNLVYYASTNFGVQAVWASYTTGSGASDYLSVGDNGQLAIYNQLHQALWVNGVYQYPSPVNIGSTLATNQKLLPNEELVSSNGWAAILQDDGNFVINTPARLLDNTFSTNTQGYGSAYLTVQSDGNVVLYDNAGKALWASGTSNWWNNYGVSSLTMQTDGNLVEFNGYGSAMWSRFTGPIFAPPNNTGGPNQTPPSCTNVGATLFYNGSVNEGQCLVSSNGQYELIIETSGLVELYNNASQVQRWTPPTEQTGPGIKLVIGPYGDLKTVDSNNNIIWHAGTNNEGCNNGVGDYLTLGPQGEIRLYDSCNVQQWWKP